jgi:hypothetical protein
MPSPFDIPADTTSELYDAIPSPFEGHDDDLEINLRRAAAENAEALRLARAL